MGERHTIALPRKRASEQTGEKYIFRVIEFQLEGIMGCRSLVEKYAVIKAGSPITSEKMWLTGPPSLL
jgi:hypothetical protein